MTTDLILLTCGMLLWMPEQFWHTNTPKMKEAQVGSVGEMENRA